MCHGRLDGANALLLPNGIGLAAEGRVMNKPQSEPPEPEADDPREPPERDDIPDTPPSEPPPVPIKDPPPDSQPPGPLIADPIS